MRIGAIRKNKLEKFASKKDEIINQICCNGINEYTLCQLVTLSKGNFRKQLRELTFRKNSPMRTWEIVQLLCSCNKERRNCLESYAKSL